MDEKPDAKSAAKIFGIVNGICSNKYKAELVLQILDKLKHSDVKIDRECWGLIEISATIKKGEVTNIKVASTKNYQINQ